MHGLHALSEMKLMATDGSPHDDVGTAGGGRWQQRAGVGSTCCTKERTVGLGSAAMTATARERGEKYNLLHEGFLKLGAPHMLVLVCFAQGVG